METAILNTIIAKAFQSGQRGAILSARRRLRSMQLFAIGGLRFDCDISSGNANSNCSSPVAFADSGIVLLAGMFAAGLLLIRI